jgi:peptide/nickel transport system permease protein
MPSSTPAFSTSPASPSAPHGAVGRWLRRDPIAAAAAGFLVTLLALAVLSATLTGYAYDQQDLNHPFLGPSVAHLLGTDQYGRDLLTRLLYGARVSLAVGLTAVAIESFAGLACGIAAGFYGGRVDAILMRIVDVLIAFPTLLLAILITGIFGPTLVNLVIALALTASPGTARTIRSGVVGLRERDFVEATRSLGASSVRILIRHVVPNVIDLLVVRATLDVSILILAEATLSFIGIGVQPPRPSWGLMISDSFQYLGSQPQLVILPSVALCLSVASLNLLGESLAQTLAPGQRYVFR